MSAHPDETLFAEEPSRTRCGKAVLRAMNPVRFDGERNIHAIVHKEPATRRIHYITRRPGQVMKVSCVPRLFSQLDGADTRFAGGAKNAVERLGGSSAVIGDE